jgi:squalene-associated FAD-dependent desaturase
MSRPRVHIVGAGLAGLAAAVRLTGKHVPVEVSEAAGHAGGRCRSYIDRDFGITIDNGNHLVLSGNRATRAYLAEIGARLDPLPSAAVPFVDLGTGRRWTVEPNRGLVPWWVFAPRRRVPDTVAADYLQLGGLLRHGGARRVDEAIRCDGALWNRLVRPFLLAALNTEPEAASASLAGAVLRETLARGAGACRPMIATGGLSGTFIDPALACLMARGAEVRYGRRLRRIIFDARRGEEVVAALDFGNEAISFAPGDALVLAVPPWAAQELVPELDTPGDFRAIVNAHFRMEPGPNAPAMIGVIGGTAEWIFTFADRVSVTVSSAGQLIDEERNRLAAMLWRDVSAVFGCPGPMPPWKLVIEKRATFAATPEQAQRRPGTRTRWANLFLAGDWVETGLPATIEGAIRSGAAAARAAAKRLASQERTIGYAASPGHRFARG